MDELSLEPEDNSLTGEDGEVENTVAYGLVQEALKFNKVKLIIFDKYSSFDWILFFVLICR